MICHQKSVHLIDIMEQIQGPFGSLAAPLLPLPSEDTERASRLVGRQEVHWGLCGQENPRFRRRAESALPDGQAPCCASQTSKARSIQEPNAPLGSWARPGLTWQVLEYRGRLLPAGPLPRLAGSHNEELARAGEQISLSVRCKAKLASTVNEKCQLEIQTHSFLACTCPARLNCSWQENQTAP